MKVLVTGVAGFIGFHVAQKLIERGDIVVGVDNLNDYYDVSLKKSRLMLLQPHGNFSFFQQAVENREGMEELFRWEKFHRVVHLAGQAGVRHSLENPAAYIDSNLVGFGNILEGCRNNGVEHLVYASSSSVYGLNRRMPFSVHDNVDHPVSLYAASKKANELMAHTYSHLFRLPTTGLRFFTVYGPWGRPDMACFLFVKAILEGKPLQVFNRGHMKRDFTYIDDIAEGVIKTLDAIAVANGAWDGENPDPGSSSAPYRLYNIGNNRPVSLLDFIATIENALGKKASLELLPIQPGDVAETCADITDLVNATGFSPRTPLAEGIERFVSWYKSYYRL